MTTTRQRLNDHLHAFCNDTDAYLAGAAHGPLAGLTFAAKDIFDVAGYVTGGGNPDWQATHAAATRTAWAVQVLVDAGATMVGKTITDEITRGILGENPHYGTPVNPRPRSACQEARRVAQPLPLPGVWSILPLVLIPVVPCVSPRVFAASMDCAQRTDGFRSTAFCCRRQVMTPSAGSRVTPISSPELAPYFSKAVSQRRAPAVWSLPRMPLKSPTRSHPGVAPVC